MRLERSLEGSPPYRGCCANSSLAPASPLKTHIRREYPTSCGKIFLNFFCVVTLPQARFFSASSGTFSRRAPVGSCIPGLMPITPLESRFGISSKHIIKHQRAPIRNMHSVQPDNAIGSTLRVSIKAFASCVRHTLKSCRGHRSVLLIEIGKGKTNE